jgi:hypothetical protein
MFSEGVQARVDFDRTKLTYYKPEHLQDGSTEGVNKYQVETYKTVEWDERPQDWRPVVTE